MSKVLTDVRHAPRSGHAAVVLLLIGLVILPMLAVSSPWWLFAIVLGSTYITETWTNHTVPAFIDILRRVQLGTSILTLIRQVAVVLLAAVSVEIGQVGLWFLAIGFVVGHMVRAAVTALLTYVTARRKLPIATRNVNLSILRIPDSIHRRWTPSQRRILFEMDIPITAGVFVAIATGFDAAIAIGAGVAITITAVRATVLLSSAYSNRHLKRKRWVLDRVRDEVAGTAPEVALYFTGSETSVYQINMWLRTLEQLDRSAVIIMRERGLLKQLGSTSVPTVCIPDNIDLMNFELPTIRVALYPGNAGKNIHMLRIPGVTHVFIGHGDSDKPASFNPFSKVYNQIWSAGKAGRDRYRVADIGVDDADIREVGRPQLHGVHLASQRRFAPALTVLYAPTWEGWTANLQHTSLVKIGPKLIEFLLREIPGVRILYRPHPLTGTRDRATLAAHRKITEILDDANTRAGCPAATWVPEDLHPLAEEIARLGSSPTDVDEAQRSRDGGFTRPDLGDEIERLRQQWQEGYWSAADPHRHHVVTKMPLPTLYEMFNQSDVLVTDISSVVSDFIASEKPYVVCNPAAQAPEAFQTTNPSTKGGYLLNPDLAGLRDILEHVEKLRADSTYEDPLLSTRRELREYLLGPTDPPSLARFIEATDEAIRVARGAGRATE
ncbi:CDP-glycerol:poly(glycerophosphate) glycerophosphotransferase [Stackebrandtia endophytica]|uniref:CDP-glycerol:poly(Glycerophosphate) glycerophosphotransferase n=1 Tax=Stackebrandtia endophytica TaxID=1496996 RepID=A0A543AZM9_9ACTN|nr:glycerophosphotransferase [Stackebrandtia endophytica]TQL78016.1 CDP-glycerol:poly(glycerophosphate) glycerophosphotransferase [Stackebrandtia endophytica]